MVLKQSVAKVADQSCHVPELSSERPPIWINKASDVRHFFVVNGQAPMFLDVHDAAKSAFWRHAAKYSIRWVPRGVFWVLVPCFVSFLLLTLVHVVNKQPACARHSQRQPQLPEERLRRVWSSCHRCVLCCVCACVRMCVRVCVCVLCVRVRARVSVAAVSRSSSFFQMKALVCSK